MKLWLVTTHIPGNCLSTQMDYSIFYVLAENPDEAYKKVRKFLDDNDIGFTANRCLNKITLLADEYKYNELGKILIL